jgi:hypothetical protein
MTKKKLSLAFWWERKKSRNNGNITDPNYKKCRNQKLQQCIITNDEPNQIY